MKYASLVIVVSIFLLHCGQNTSVDYQYSAPKNMDDGFTVGSLTDVNIDPELIENGVKDILQEKYKEVHSLVIYKDGKLVLDEYFSGHRHVWEDENHHGELVDWDQTMVHHVMSVTKSITSACIGIAVDHGYINSVHQSIFDFLPDHQHLNKVGKGSITIEHLLTMTAGLKWNEWALPYSNRENDVIKSYFADDAVSFFLEKQLLDEPGQSFNYCGGCNNLLGEILKNATQMNLDKFSGKYLFGPLGIDPYFWAQYRNGVIDAAGSIRITPRAMAKIGVTFLNKGLWNGVRIISEDWVEKSATAYPGNSWMNDWDDHYGMRGYSYSWWTHQFVHSGKRINMFYAAGWGGQFIMVLPQLDMVVVYTGGNYTTFRPPFEILKEYIMPAVGGE